MVGAQFRTIFLLLLPLTFPLIIYGLMRWSYKVWTIKIDHLGAATFEKGDLR